MEQVGYQTKKRKYKFSYFFLVFCFFLELPFEVLSHFVLTQLLLCSGRAGKLTGWFRNCFSSVLRFIARGLSGLCCLMWRSRFFRDFICVLFILNGKEVD